MFCIFLTHVKNQQKGQNKKIKSAYFLMALFSIWKWSVPLTGCLRNQEMAQIFENVQLCNSLSFVPEAGFFFFSVLLASEYVDNCFPRCCSQPKTTYQCSFQRKPYAHWSSALKCARLTPSMSIPMYWTCPSWHCPVESSCMKKPHPPSSPPWYASHLAQHSMKLKEIPQHLQYVRTLGNWKLYSTWHCYLCWRLRCRWMRSHPHHTACRGWLSPHRGSSRGQKRVLGDKTWWLLLLLELLRDEKLKVWEI